MKKRICVVITARPSYSRIKTVLSEIKNHSGLQLQLVIAASALLDRYGSAVDFIEKDGFVIDEKVFMVLEGTSPASMAKTTGLGILELATTFDNLKPDMVLTVADRYETMATAIAASYMNIPLVHIQGGEVTGNIDEKVRHAISKLADLHLVASDDARQRLIKMGEYPDVIFTTGCPSLDLAKEVLTNPEINFDPCKKYGGVGYQVKPGESYLMVLQHPVTTEHEEAFTQVTQTLETIKKLDIPTYWFWPNVDAGSDGTSSGIRNFREINPDCKIRFFKNMDGIDFLKMIYHSLCLIGNSSVGIRECSFLGVPVVNIGSRQNRRERADNVLDVDHDIDKILNAVQTQLKKGKYVPSTIYGDGLSGKRIANLLFESNPLTKKTISY